MMNKKHVILNINRRLLKTIVALMLMAVGTTTAWGQCTITVVADQNSSYTPTQIANGDFSTTPTMAGSGNNRIPNGTNQGWNTTENGINCFEYLCSGINWIPSQLTANGNCMVEMNADNESALYQDLFTHGGDVIRWSLKHAVRYNPISSPKTQAIRVEVGAPNYNGANIVYPHGVTTNINTEINNITKASYIKGEITNPNAETYGYVGQMSDLDGLYLDRDGDHDAWYSATGVYVIPEGQGVTRFAFVSYGATNGECGGCGNFLDDLTFSTLIGNMTATYGTNNSVIISGYWGDTDASKQLVVNVGNQTFNVDMSGVIGQNFTVTIPGSCIGTNFTGITFYHQDYPSAARTIAANLPITATAADVHGICDGVTAYGITPVVTDPTDGYTIRYGSTYGDITLSELTYIYGGTYPIYYSVSKEGYTTKIGMATVTIDKGHMPANLSITPPTALYQEYNNQLQTLISAGSAGGLVMVYALGEDNVTAPNSGWSTNLPKGKYLGNYYVWYKVLGGDSFYENSEPQCVVASITASNILTLNLAVNNAAWGTIETQSTIYANDFETGTFDLPEGWTNDDLYSWIVGQKDNTYCLKSGNYNVASSSSSIQATYDFADNGLIRFHWIISSENNYDYGRFYVDGAQKLNKCGNENGNYTFDVTAGTHTFEWRYEKDVSVNNNDDAFYIDDIVIIENRPDITTSVQGISGDKFLVTAIPSSDDDYFVNWTSNNVVVSTEPTYMITLTETTELTANFQKDFEGSGTADDPYLIPSTEVWNRLATKVNGGTNYAGKYFRQTEDIGTTQEPVTHMVGIYSSTQSENRLFSGTYDGKGHTLTFSYGAAEAYGNEDHVAPFRHVGGENAQTPARIQNLHVTGHIYTSTKYAAGIIAQNGSWVNMENCRSSMVIHSSVGGDGSHGGLVGGIDGTLSITGCAFDGKLLSTGTTATNSCGGFIGWNGGSTLSITNSLYAPATIDTEHGENEVNASSSATFSRNGASITNCYYTRTLGTEQGERAYSVTGGTGVTVAAAGEPTASYNVSGLNFFGTNGLTLNGAPYGGNGDAVSLNLTHGDAPTGYSFSHYSVTSGTLSGTDNPYSLTMPANNVTVDATYSINTYTLTLTADGYGNVAVNTPLPSGVTNNNNGTYTVNYGTEVTLTATPAADYHFVHWQDGNSDNPRTITVTDDATYTATFAINEYRLDSIRTTWQVKIGDATPIFPTPYVTVNPTAADTMGYVMIPVGAEFVIIPSEVQKPLVSKLGLIDKTLDLSTVTTDTIVPNGWTVTGTLGSNVKISIADGATVTLNGATINGVHDWSYQWAGLNCIGDATIILSGDNTVKGFHRNYPGIHVPSGKTLTIQGTGSLDASSNDIGAAGIGGGWSLSCGNIIINGGTITAIGGDVGIGSGRNGSSCGAISINGGTVTATGSNGGAGIGSGMGSSSCGAISISGGTVTATTTCSNNGGAGIGSGLQSSCGAITISGGTVEATGCNAAAGIGTGYLGTCADGITIMNTVTRVTATKGSNNAESIGAGISGSCGTVTIGGVTGAISTSPYTYIPGAISGKFSVSSTKQVYFSQGNLQATTSNKGSTWTWAFAAHQWDYIGDAVANNSVNGNGTVATNGTVDLFGWSTAATTFGILNSTISSNYSGDFVDWGATIGSGWRTLTSDEWQYVFNTRNASTVNSTENARYAKAYLFGTKHGVILFPDSYTHPDGVAAPTGINATNDASWYANMYSADDWAKMEAAGCVFLPAAGYRSGSSVSDVGSYGYYWSSSFITTNYTYRVYFNYGSMSPTNYNDRYNGCSVRLVRDAE